MRSWNFNTTDPVIKLHFIFLSLKRDSVYFELSPSDLNCFKGYTETVFVTAYQIKEMVWEGK